MSEFVGKSIYLWEYRMGYANQCEKEMQSTINRLHLFFNLLAQYTHKLSPRASKYQAPFVLRAHRREQEGRS